MYESFFGMKLTPFGRNINTSDLFETKTIREALGRLKYAADNQLFAVVSAEPGCGKSTLIRKLKDSLSSSDYLILYLSDSKLTPRCLYQGLLDQLGMEAHFYRGNAKRQLQQQIDIIHGVQHRKVVCILDEAHLLERETLEEFRFLLNYEMDSESPMALILVGQTELIDNKLRLQRYTAIRQRININCILNPLDRAETEGYIKSHLKYAGCDQEIFTAKAIDEIYGISAGIMRVINRVCEKSLMYAAQQQSRLIDDYQIRYVAEHEMLKA